MSSYELPQNVAVTGNDVSREQMISATQEETQISTEHSTIQKSPVTGGNGQPFVIDPVAFRAMTPAESFALAGEMVKENHEQQVEKENASVLAEEREVTESNKEEAKIIAAEIADEESALEAKYGPKENWPDEIKKEADTHRLGWGFAAVAGIGALAGLAGSTDANAGGFNLGDIIAGPAARQIVGNRIGQGMQIETQRENQELQNRVSYENHISQTEMRIEQGRMQMENSFEQQANQKNLSYENELSRARTNAEARSIQERQDRDWQSFVNTIQLKRQQFENNAQMQVQQARMNYENQIRQTRANADMQQRQQDASARQQGIQNVVNGRW